MSVSAEESAVKVCVRVRPAHRTCALLWEHVITVWCYYGNISLVWWWGFYVVGREERATAEDSVPAPLYWKADRKSIHQLDDGVTTRASAMIRGVQAPVETTNHLYQDIAKPLVVSAVEGYNGTIFAYGRPPRGRPSHDGQQAGSRVIPLSMEEVFQTIQKREENPLRRKPLEVREALNKNIYVADLTEELVTCLAQALSWVFKGEKNRHYGKTKMNERSSRSHTIFRMILESREKSDPASGDNSEGAIIVSHLNLVDLAGSEQASQTGAEGARFKEGCNINRSLFTLAQVIKKLSDESQRGFTNYRDSKLTRILQNSLGGNAKTVIICTITMAALEETLSTLQVALCVGLQGAGLQGAGLEGAGLEGLEGVGLEGVGLQGAGLEGVGLEGLEGEGLQGVGLEGVGLQGAGLEGVGLEQWSSTFLSPRSLTST
ncbi:unnamed protein product [Boreogadus saida]